MQVAGTNERFFSVRSEQHNNALSLYVGGELDIASLPALEETLLSAVSNGNAEIVVDLERVTFIDASGLGAFIRAADRATEGGRSFAIVRPPPFVRKILTLTGTTYLLGSDPPMVSIEPQRRDGVREESKAEQMCCDGKRTAAEHRNESSDGKCCTDS